MLPSMPSSTPFEYVEGHKLSTAQLQMFKGTKFCKFFLAGSCDRGESCWFAHGLDTLKEPPDFSKTRFCEAFVLTGACRAGRRCRYAHGRHELRNIYAKKTRKHSDAAFTSDISDEQKLQEQLSIVLEMMRIKRVRDDAMMKLMLKGVQQKQLLDPRVLNYILHSGELRSLDFQEADLQSQSFSGFSRQTTIDITNSVRTISREVSPEEDQVDVWEPTGSHQHHDVTQIDYEEVYVPVIKNTFVHMELQPVQCNKILRSRSSPAFA